MRDEDCPRMIALSALVDDEIAAEARLTLLAHARHCPLCGAALAELRALRETMLAMLTKNGSPPDGRFEDLKYLEPVRDYKARHASTMLTFDAVVDAIAQIESKQADMTV